MRAVSLNVTVGLRANEPREIYKFATMVSIACDGPGVNESTIKQGVTYAKESWAKIVALVSYPAHGRPIRGDVDPEDVRNTVRNQCVLLMRAAEWQGTRVFVVKPSDALLEVATANRSVADAIIDGAIEGLEVDVPFIGPFEGPMLDYVRTGGLDYLREAYADRGYRTDGTLLPKDDPGFVLTDATAAGENALRLAKTSRFDAIGVHGDESSAVDITGRVRTILESQGLLSR